MMSNNLYIFFTRIGDYYREEFENTTLFEEDPDDAAENIGFGKKYSVTTLYYKGGKIQNTKTINESISHYPAVLLIHDDITLQNELVLKEDLKKRILESNKVFVFHHNSNTTGNKKAFGGLLTDIDDKISVLDNPQDGGYGFSHHGKNNPFLKLFELFGENVNFEEKLKEFEAFIKSEGKIQNDKDLSFAIENLHKVLGNKKEEVDVDFLKRWENVIDSKDQIRSIEKIALDILKEKI